MSIYKWIIVILVVLFTSASAWAVCSNCSTSAATCTTGTSDADVTTCISSLTSNGTITFDAGTYSGTWDWINAKGAALICATKGACTHSGMIRLSSHSGTNTNTYRISGFSFTTTGIAIQFGISMGQTGTVENIRIDNNTFTNGLIDMGDDSSCTASYYGVIDNNAWAATNNNECIRLMGAHQPDNWSENSLGTSKNMFVEDNTFIFTNHANAGAGSTDAWGNNGVVYRYNTSTNARMITHGIQHGGPRNAEWYNNTISTGAGAVDPGYRLIHHQGSGTMMAFNNILSPANGSNIAVLHYRASLAVPTICDGTQAVDGNWSPVGTFHGYPCWHQPGRDKDETLYPMYFWNNYISSTGAIVTLSVEGTNSTYHIVADRDYYQAVSANAQTSSTSPFNGTTGMGFGTLANRPTTCTVGPYAGVGGADEGKGGVGYFATDVGAQGTLYMCSATNTWTVYYTPYTYPHPLRGEGSAPVPNLTGVTITGGSVQ